MWVWRNLSWKCILNYVLGIVATQNILWGLSLQLPLCACDIVILFKRFRKWITNSVQQSKLWDNEWLSTIGSLLRAQRSLRDGVGLLGQRCSAPYILKGLFKYNYAVRSCKTQAHLFILTCACKPPWHGSLQHTTWKLGQEYSHNRTLSVNRWIASNYRGIQHNSHLCIESHL